MIDAIIFYSKILFLLTMVITFIVILYLLITGWDEDER